MSNESGWRLRFRIKSTEPVIISVIYINDKKHNILSDFGIFQVSFDVNFPNKILFFDIVYLDWFIVIFGCLIIEIKDITIFINCDRIFYVVNLQGFFVFASFFHAVNRYYMLLRVWCTYLFYDKITWHDKDVLILGIL